MSEPTIYKRPNLYKSNVQKRYSCYKGLGVYKLPYGMPQEWTKDNVPEGVQTVHDFGDGQGAVPAIPVDSCGVRNYIIGVVTYPVNADSCGVRNYIIGVVTYPVNADSCGVRNDIIGVVTYPVNADSCGVRNDIISAEIIE